jgi:hypothetical protein
MTWGYVALAVVAAAGTTMSAISASNAAKYNADVAEQNAIAERNRAQYEENAHRRNVQKLLSAQRALYGKANVEMEGSPLLVMEDTAGQGELDALAIRFGGDIAAAKQRSAANLARMQGSSALTSGYVSAGTSLLTSASKVNMPTTTTTSYPRH